MNFLSYFGKRISGRLVLSFIVAFCFQSCFTGVEGTSKITLSKKDINITTPSPEEEFLEEIRSMPLKEWQKGKRFLITDEKFRYVITGNTQRPVSKGDTITFESINSGFSAGGGENSLLALIHEGETVYYPLEKTIEKAENDLTSDRLPMLIDLEMVENIRKKLSGKKLWTKSALWYNDNMIYQKGKKFVPVTIKDVQPGNSFFPLLIKFEDDEQKVGYFLMNTGNSGNESRSFDRLFYLSDPRNQYRQISEENWEAIQKEEVRVGMTKEECRLSKGNPSEMDSGHTYSNTMEIWKYTDGTLLRFVDGLLISFK